jgi:hypothetical protein
VRLSTSLGGSPTKIRVVVTPVFLAPNESPTNSRVFSKLSRWVHLSPSEPRSSSPSLTLGAGAANPAGTARTRAVAPLPAALAPLLATAQESRARRGPAGRSASPSPPSQNHADARNRKTPQNPFSPFPKFS